MGDYFRVLYDLKCGIFLHSHMTTLFLCVFLIVGGYLMKTYQII